MSVVGEFTIPAASFALDHALTSMPEMRIVADRLASHSTMQVFPFLWATGGDQDAFREALEEDSSVEEVSVADEFEDEVLYRFEWDDSFCDLVDEMIDHHAAITDASASDGEWRLQLRFAKESMVSEFQTHFRETGRTFEVHSLHRPTEPRQQVFGLTSEQAEALKAAVDVGYFDVPRPTSIEELGDRLGISANATSQRLRRGSRTLVRETLSGGEDAAVVDGANEDSTETGE